jgi:hypothetical protein
MPEVMGLAKINSGLMFRHGQKSVLSLLTIGLSACFELFSAQERATEAEDRSVLRVGLVHWIYRLPRSLAGDRHYALRYN